jgi:Ca2+-binding EF-hand superfamily protein
MDNAVEKAYAGWPDRIYIVGADGAIAYKGGPGPAGFRPHEAEEALRRLLGVPEGAPFATDLDAEKGGDRFDAKVAELFKAADAGGRGAIGREAFAALVPQLRQAWIENAPRSLRPGRRDEILSNEAMLLKFDKDGDGRLSLEERKVMDEDEKAENRALFDRVDADRDGAATEAEIRAVMSAVIGESYREIRGGDRR